MPQSRPRRAPRRHCRGAYKKMEPIGSGTSTEGVMLQCSIICMGCKGSRVQISALRPVSLELSLLACGHPYGHFDFSLALRPLPIALALGTNSVISNELRLRRSSSAADRYCIIFLAGLPVPVSRNESTSSEVLNAINRRAAPAIRARLLCFSCCGKRGSGASADNSLRSAAEALKGTLVSVGEPLEIRHFCFATCGSSVRQEVFAGPKSLDAPEPMSITSI